jgi:hypothetical protein
MVTELEEVPMSIVGGLDVHRKQLTFDYIEAETGGWSGAGSRWPTASIWRVGLPRFDGQTSVAFALEAGTGWRYVVEETRKVGVEPHLAEPADTSVLLRELLATGRVPQCYIPPRKCWSGGRCWSSTTTCA